MEFMTTGEPVGGPAQEAVDRLLDQGFLDELMAKVDEGGVQLTGEGGFLPELVKRVLEAVLQAELTDHLGYERHDRTGMARVIPATELPRSGWAPRSAILT
jgi:putative transposase